MDDLDHPVLFLLFVTLGVIGVTNLLQWGSAHFGIFGLKSATH